MKTKMIIMKKRITLMLYAIFWILVTTNSLKAKTKSIDNILAKLEQVGDYASSINNYDIQDEQFQLNAYLSAKNIERASGAANWFAINNSNEFGTFNLSDNSTMSANGSLSISDGVFENARAIYPAEPNKAWASSAFTNATVCTGPLTVNVNNITSSGADLSWDAEATAALGYEWVVMPADVAPVIDGFTEVATGTTDSATLDGHCFWTR